MIDLRSDTVTVPTKEMLNSIINAKVGDDVFGDDPTVIELQEYTADLLGKEAALYVPSGTMSNQIAIAIQTKRADEVIVDADAHIYYYEAAAPAAISGVQMRPVKTERGVIPLNDLKNSIRVIDDHFPRTALLCLENTHNRHGGTIIPLDYIKQVKKIVDENKISFHCDGARLWNACAATGISPKEYAEPFNTISVCLSKALGAPVGSLLTGSKELITEGRRKRKMLGGGMRQAGIIAAAGLYALRNNINLLKRDHENAKTFAKLLFESELITLDINRVETNIVYFKLDSKINGMQFEEECKKKGLLLLHLGNNSVRVVFHYQADESVILPAVNIIKDVAKNLSKR
ncbi:MAG: aminotransferase class I/II-fold pyridoxal phosphate-dependent enzyme [Ignavibacteriae bacterium]|nr:aminotransferase class I/II-fold pyridoxal phosphate-dependent enzyme [Ignavibacteriota bacterium]